ncbi:Carboxysome shell and ethanolamine utilization microcompartment protein CcmL/EutN [Natronincola peptidivorans]|uniref:Carboxysome shell and ethanolamine utilization microcompartment protein CcmL/EutN n=1 Tax=Natronincola peptidivorans TaxID=426128 RepID=A0A1I0CYS1_9FIRM|nr:BMC domain-containing protein [Natronincola peptidivorans]SET25026.1 Carboxysome shell and ethanolamine utilization microcompartment protein CcmL/EutN [Natronincola peptidivorans]
MIRTIGLIELNSIAKGIEATDKMVKAAEVELLFSKAVCPGKFIVSITGDVAAVKAAVEIGVSEGEHYVVDHLMLPNVAEEVICAINGVSSVENVNALGVMEFFSIAAAMVAADRAVKTAAVDLLEVRLGIGIGGKSFITLTGDVSSVTAAVDAAVIEAGENGMLVEKAVIPSPTKELFDNLL